MGKQNNVVTREILFLAMWFIEQKVIIFRCRTDIRDEPAWPRRSLTAYFSSAFKDMNLKLLHIIDTCLKIFVSKFQTHFFVSFEVTTFFTEDRFLPFLHTYLRITQEEQNIFKL